MAVLKIENVSKRFPGVTALENVSLELKEGEVCALCGENGAGKSTLIKILSGIYKKDSGRILIDDQEVEISDPNAAEALGIAFVHQELNLVPSFTVGQSIFLGREPINPLTRLIKWSKLYKDCSAILSSIADDLNPRQKIINLSVAEKQLVAIGRALSINARIIVFDEPTSSLPKDAVEKLFFVIKNLKAKGLSIIYVSHRLEEIFNIADRIVVLKDGKNAGNVPISEIDTDGLISMMVGKKLSEQYPKKETPIGESIFTVDGLSREGVIEDISFKIGKGEILGIYGLVGSGRSELAETIFGIRPHDRGSLQLNGKYLSIHSPKDAIREGICLVPEERRLQGFSPNISVKNNLTIANLKRCSSRIGIINQDQEKKDSEILIRQMNIVTPSIYQNVKFLSGGNQQKVVLGKWLYSNSQIYIFDEPTKGIDIGAKREIYNLIYDLARSGAGIIFISSEIPEILGVCDRVLVMRSGKIVTEANVDEISADTILSYAILGRSTNGN